MGNKNKSRKERENGIPFGNLLGQRNIFNKERFVFERFWKIRTGVYE